MKTRTNNLFFPHLKYNIRGRKMRLSKINCCPNDDTFLYWPWFFLHFGFLFLALSTSNAQGQSPGQKLWIYPLQGCCSPAQLYMALSRPSRVLSIVQVKKERPRIRGYSVCWGSFYLFHQLASFAWYPPNNRHFSNLKVFKFRYVSVTTKLEEKWNEFALTFSSDGIYKNLHIYTFKITAKGA